MKSKNSLIDWCSLGIVVGLTVLCFLAAIDGQIAMCVAVGTLALLILAILC